MKARRSPSGDGLGTHRFSIHGPTEYRMALRSQHGYNAATIHNLEQLTSKDSSVMAAAASEGTRAGVRTGDMKRSDLTRRIASGSVWTNERSSVQRGEHVSLLNIINRLLRTFKLQWKAGATGLLEISRHRVLQRTAGRSSLPRPSITVPRLPVI